MERPRERVKAYIDEFYRRWKECSDASSPSQRWREEVEALDANHFVDGAGSGAQREYSSRPEHKLDLETITGERITGENAWVETKKERPREGFSKYYEYRLQRSDDHWLITEIRCLNDLPDMPMVS